MVFCSFTIKRKIKLSKANMTWHYWIDWVPNIRKSCLTYKRKKCCFTQTIPDVTCQGKRWLNWKNYVSNYFPTMYSLDLAPCDYWFFCILEKRFFRKTNFLSNEEVVVESQAYFKSKNKSFYKNVLKKIEEHCIE